MNLVHIVLLTEGVEGKDDDESAIFMPFISAPAGKWIAAAATNWPQAVTASIFAKCFITKLSQATTPGWSDWTRRAISLGLNWLGKNGSSALSP